MDKRQTIRWAILLSALGLTIGAIFLPADEPLPAERAIQQRLVAPPASKPAAERLVAATEVTAQWVATAEDPFAPRGWVAPPPAAPLVLPQPVAPVDAPPPPPPPLPYKVVGQMVDGSERVIYLNSGEQVLLARPGEVLDGGYRVVAVSPNQIEFESVASGIRQTLPLNSPDN